MFQVSIVQVSLFNVKIYSVKTKNQPRVQYFRQYGNDSVSNRTYKNPTLEGPPGNA